jgi:iron complex transport system substrate-binding protein
MRKILCMLLTGIMVLSAAGCGAKETVNEPAAQETIDETTEGETPIEGTHVIVDHAGYEVEVPYEIDRIAVGGILPLPSVLAVFFDSADIRAT